MDPVAGAAAYRVLVSLDRDAQAVIGTSPLVAGTSLPAAQVAWQPGYPTRDRPYFWQVWAYDSNSVGAHLLQTGVAREIDFSQAQPNFTFGSVTATATPSASAAASPSAAATASAAASPAAAP